MAITQNETYYLIKASYRDAQGRHSTSFEFQSESKELARSKVYYHLKEQGYTEIDICKTTSHKGKVYAAPGL